MEDEVKPKKLPRLRKANFSTIDELILQREIEKNFDVIKEKYYNDVTNV
jgi:U3 small nucleolar ribonucleoprotein component